MDSRLIVDREEDVLDGNVRRIDGTIGKERATVNAEGGGKGGVAMYGEDTDDVSGAVRARAAIEEPSRADVAIEAEVATALDRLAAGEERAEDGLLEIENDEGTEAEVEERRERRQGGGGFGEERFRRSGGGGEKLGEGSRKNGKESNAKLLRTANTIAVIGRGSVGRGRRVEKGGSGSDGKE